MMFLNDPVHADKVRDDTRYSQRFALSEVRDGERVIDWEKLNDVLVAHASVPQPLVHHTMREFLEGKKEKQRTAAETLASVLKQSPRTTYGVYLTGRPRTGKTSLAVATLRMALRRGLCVKFISADSFIRFYQDKIDLSKNSHEFDDVGERLDDWHRQRWMLERVYDVLVFDDFGRMASSDFFVNEVHPLIRHRYESGLLTIITTNVDKDDADALIDERMKLFIKSEFQQIAFPSSAVVA